MSDKIKLNNCPFCGGSATWCGDDPIDRHDCHVIRCDQCDVNFDMCTHNVSDREELIDLQQYCADKFNKQNTNQCLVRIKSDAINEAISHIKSKAEVNKNSSRELIAHLDTCEEFASFAIRLLKGK